MGQRALRIPKPARPGDTIGIVAPGFPVKPEEKEKMIRCLHTAGYRVKLGKTVEQLMNFHNYLAGDARARADDINDMFADPRVKAILCARGGYGSSQVMPWLDLEVIAAHPKVFVGYSDITNFHSVLNKCCDMVTFHGPMMISNILKGFDAYSKSSLQSAVFMKETYEFFNPSGDPMWTVVPGRAEGRITGGNLTLTERALGTFYQIDTEGKILLLEDVEESFPAIDMMVTHLEQAGMMDGIAGLLLGNFADCTNERYDKEYRLNEFIRDRFSGYRVPVIANVCSGHARPMGTIPMGTVCRMDAARCTVVFSAW